ncbi:hypothetical protein TNCV_3811911 [Trichonephila clavipes]|nr:hypothetical protein TNCV_3811911 [Trichonephila clavipes]
MKWPRNDGVGGPTKLMSQCPFFSGEMIGRMKNHFRHVLLLLYAVMEDDIVIFAAIGKTVCVTANIATSMKKIDVTEYFSGRGTVGLIQILVSPGTSF